MNTLLLGLNKHKQWKICLLLSLFLTLSCSKSSSKPNNTNVLQDFVDKISELFSSESSSPSPKEDLSSGDLATANNMNERFSSESSSPPLEEDLSSGNLAAACPAGENNRDGVTYTNVPST